MDIFLYISMESPARPGLARPGPARPGPARPDPARVLVDSFMQMHKFYGYFYGFFYGMSSPARPGPARPGPARPGPCFVVVGPDCQTEASSRLIDLSFWPPP